MGTKPFTYPITDKLRHGVATLCAAGMRNSQITILLPATDSSIKAIQREDGWPALLEAKREALQALMGGQA